MTTSPQPQNSSTPPAGVGLLDTLFTSAQLAASSAWTASSVVSVSEARKIVMYCKVSIASSATAARVRMRVQVSGGKSVALSTTAPAVGDDSWYHPVVLDAAPTATVLTGTVATGEDFTVQPEFNVHAALPGAYLLGAASDADTDELRLALVMDVTAYRWLYIAAQEIGDTTNRSTLEVLYALSY